MSRAGVTRVPQLRWWIAGLLAAATALNYLDRQNLPVAISEIQKSIAISDRQYSNLQTMFLLAYGIMYAGGGRILDWLGTRRGYALMIAWWSGANFVHGLVASASGLAIARFLLGLGEGGGFPGSAKAVAEWFPARERSLAFGIFNMGSSVGAVIAPPLIAGVSLWLGWRWVFFLSGAAGFLWALAWLRIYDFPETHARITAEEREYLAATRPAIVEAPKVRWVELFRYREVTGLLLAKFFSDAAWYFYIFWLPKYLGDARHLDIKQIGYYAWIPYAVAGAGSLSGGWLSGRLLRGGLTIDRSRKIALGISAAIMPVALLIAASPLSLALVFFSLAMYGHQFWSTVLQTLAADMFPPKVVGTVAGLMGAAGSFGGIFFSVFTGWLLTAYGSYAPLFLVAGMMHPASFGILVWLVRKIEPLPAIQAEALAGLKSRAG
jgi:ACS family hexuronate transporter-like MFS transporter